MTGDEGAAFGMLRGEGTSFGMTRDEGAVFRMRGDEGVSFRMTEWIYFSSLKRFVCQMSAEPSFQSVSGSVTPILTFPHREGRD